MTEKALITNIQKFSVHDGPGIRTTVFLKGCPLSCKWCANPENISTSQQVSIIEAKCIGCGICKQVCEKAENEKCTSCGKCAKACPAEARKLEGEEYTASRLIKELSKDIPFFLESGGGVTFSGGEPLLKPEFISQIWSFCKREKIGTAIETCGYVNWESFEKVLKDTDLFLFDVKHIDREKHKKFCGVYNDLILQNLKRLKESGADIIVRIPVIPSVNDDEETLRGIGGVLKDSGIERVHCLPYHNYGVSKYDGLGVSYELENITSPSDEDMERVTGIISEYIGEVQIGG